MKEYELQVSNVEGRPLYSGKYKATCHKRAFDLFIDNIDIRLPNVKEVSITVWVSYDGGLSTGKHSKRFDYVFESKSMPF